MKDPLEILTYKGDEELSEPNHPRKPTKYRIFNMQLSNEQLQALHDAPMGVTISQYVRNLIRADFEADGLEWPNGDATFTIGDVSVTCSNYHPLVEIVDGKNVIGILPRDLLTLIDALKARLDLLPFESGPEDEDYVG